MEKQQYEDFTSGDFILDDDFRKWAGGTCTAQESMQWENWLAANPGKAGDVQKAKEILLALSFKTFAVDDRTIDSEWKKFVSVIETGPEEIPETSRFLNSRDIILKIAAAIFVIISFFTAKQFLTPFLNSGTAEEITKVAGRGERLTIKLTDGTIVRLNAGSSLTYPSHFRPEKREVHLQGEAYFEVAHNSKSPFIIQSGEITTQVIGTTFSIQAYPENGELHVAVVEGKVKVNARNDPQRKEVYLTKNEMVTFKKSDKDLIVSGFDQREQLGWKDGILYFEQSDFETTVKKLERWYGVKIRVDALKKPDPDWRFSGKFDNKPLDYILNVVRYPDLFSFEIKNDTVNIK